MMKTILENWKNFIRQPARTLHDIGGYSADPDMKLGKHLPGIGYSEIENPKFIEGMKTIFSRTEGNWVIILMKNVNYYYEQLNTEHFVNWLTAQNYPEDSKILVVASFAGQDDYTSPEWIVHDIIGHTVGKEFLRRQPQSHVDRVWLAEKPYRKQLIKNLLNLLNGNKQKYPISNAEEVFDSIYDVFASIVLNHLTIQDALSVAESDDQKKLVNQMFNFSNQWVNSIPSDNKKITLVYPFD